MKIRSFLNVLKEKLNISSEIITHRDIYSKVKNIKQPVILEAGAADGSDTLKFSKMFPNAIIYAFEPVSKNYEVLNRTVCNCRNVFTQKLALADFNGQVEMNISMNTESKDNVATSSSLLRPAKHIELHPRITFDEKEFVTAKTMDSWAKENEVTHIDVLWLDMQGMEYAVLQSSPEILKTVKIIYTEISLVEMYEGVTLYEEYKKWLLSLGFEVIKEELLWKDMGNVLFARNQQLL